MTAFTSSLYEKRMPRVSIEMTFASKENSEHDPESEYIYIYEC
jgi:hypothetical protein